MDAPLNYPNPCLTHTYMNGEEHGVEIALAWPGLELIFFTAARILLCFGFVTKSALITEVLELFGAALTPCQGLLWLSGCTASKEAGLGGGRPRTANPGCRRDVPCRVVLHSAVKAGEKTWWWRNNTKTLAVGASMLPCTHYAWRNPVSWQWQNICLQGEAASSFFLSLYPLNCLISAHKFSLFYPSDPLPHPAGKKRASGCAVSANPQQLTEPRPCDIKTAVPSLDRDWLQELHTKLHTRAMRNSLSDSEDTKHTYLDELQTKLRRGPSKVSNQANHIGLRKSLKTENSAGQRYCLGAVSQIFPLFIFLLQQLAYRCCCRQVPDLTKPLSAPAQLFS